MPCSLPDQQGILNRLYIIPARRGRGILVEPGFCPVAGVWCHVFLSAQKLKNYWLFFFLIST